MAIRLQAECGGGMSEMHDMMIKILEAHRDGRQIQSRVSGKTGPLPAGEWEDYPADGEPHFSFGNTEYRIKPTRCECRALTARVAQLEFALKTIVEHQKMLGGELAQWSTTRLIAEKALKQQEQRCEELK